MSEKQSSKERIKEITAGIEKGIMELFESDRYRNYLTTMSRFHKYSLNNVMLIHAQRPDATLVAGFNKWKNSFGRHVKKGEKGIQILAPTPYKIKQEAQKLDPDTKLPLLDENGEPVTEEKEVTIPMFKVVSVFDVSQTDGRPLPQISSTLTGDVAEYEIFLEALRRTSPVPISFQAMEPGMDGYFAPKKQKIFLREGMSQVQTICAAVHEIAHSKLHDYEHMTELADDRETILVPGEKSRNTEEVEAESISYAVCQYFGIQTSENSFGYIASWSKDKELKELRASLETINKTSCELINDIERNYKEICKERGIDLTATPEPEQTPPQAVKEVSQPSAEYQEALLVLDDATYLHVQPCDTGWDYTLYDVATMKQMDGGQLDGPDMGRSAAVSHICKDLGLGDKSIKYAPLSMIETLYEQASQQTAEAAAALLPDAQEQALDEYPMPDPVLTQDDLEKCGCLDSDLLPLSKERAYELMERDLTVYIIQEGENPVMAFDTADLDAHDGIFALPREEWEESPEFDKLVKDRMAHQEEREQAFLSHKGDCFAIYQVKHTDELRDIRYEGLEWLQSIGQTVQRDNYELVYTAPLLPSDLKGDTAEQLFYRFNNEHPADYRHPSMSVSDIVAIKRDGKVSCHYCDSFGFEQVPGFLPDNPLKNAEMVVEDDYGMIDGIINNGPKEPTVAQLEQQARSGQPISLMDLAAAHREEREKKKSVMEQLKSQPKAEHKKIAPKKSAEREI